MQRNCSACGVQIDESVGSGPCPSCGAEADVFVDGIPLPGKDSGSGSSDELDLDDLFGDGDGDELELEGSGEGAGGVSNLDDLFGDGDAIALEGSGDGSGDVSNLDDLFGDAVSLEAEGSADDDLFGDGDVESGDFSGFMADDEPVAAGRDHLFGDDVPGAGGGTDNLSSEFDELFGEAEDDAYSVNDSAFGEAQPADDDDGEDLDDLFGEDDLIALPGTGSASHLEGGDLDDLFGDNMDDVADDEPIALGGSGPPAASEPVAGTQDRTATAASADAFELGLDDDPLAALLADEGPLDEPVAAASSDPTAFGEISFDEDDAVEEDDFGGFSLEDDDEDPLLDVLGGDLDEFLQEPAETSYQLRMPTGDVVGPYMGDRVENMLRTGMLRGDEELSEDGQSWQLLADHPDFAAFVNRSNLPGGDGGAPSFSSVGDEASNLPELVGVKVEVVDAGAAPQVNITHEESAQPKQGSRKKLLIGVGLLVVAGGVGLWQLGLGAGDDGGAAVPRSRAGVATTSSRFARIKDVLKEDQLAPLMQRRKLLSNAVKQSNNEDLEARVALARISCDLNIRFDMPLERMKMMAALKGMTEEMIRGNAFDIARACRSLANREDGQVDRYLARHIKAKDVEALQLGILAAAAKEDEQLLEQRREMALEAGGPGYVERTHFTAARAYERMKSFENARKAYATVTDGDSTRADAWLGQSRTAWAQIKDLDPRQLSEEQLVPIEETLHQARRQLDSLDRHMLWRAQIHEILGEIQLRRSDFGAAARFLEKAAEMLPKDTHLVERIAHVLRLGGDFEGSIATWERLLKMSPNSEAGIVGLSDVYIQTAAYERGASRVQELISKQKKPSAASQFWHAELLWLMGERKQAREMYEKVLRTDPQFVRALVAMARIDIENGKLDMATRRLQTARSIDAENPWIYVGFGDFYRTQDNYELAEREYREAIRRAETEPRAHYLLAKCLLKQKRVEEALEAAATALSIEERNPKYMVQKASILDRLDRTDEAVNLMKRAIRMMPQEDGFYVQLALTLLKRGRVAEARNYLVTASGIDRKNGNIPYLLGVTYVEKSPEEALGFLHTADKLRPKHGPTLLSMGEAYYRSNQLLDAINALTESIQADSSTADAREWRARAYRDQGQYPEALLDLDQALRIRGDVAGLHYDRAEVYRRWGGKEQLDNALTAYRKAVGADATMGKAYCRMAELQIDRNRFRQAMRSAKRCVHFEPKSGSGYLSLGMLYKESGKYKKAVDALKSSLEADPRGEFAERAQAELDALRRYR